jgi:hypothetical protein
VPTPVRNPSILFPYIQCQSAVRLKEIDTDIGSLRAQLVQEECGEKPVSREFQNTVIKIFALKDPEGQHLPGFDFGFELRIKSSPWRLR